MRAQPPAGSPTGYPGSACPSGPAETRGTVTLTGFWPLTPDGLFGGKRAMMPATPDALTAKKIRLEPSAEKHVARELAPEGPGAGPVPDRPGRLLKQLTKTVLGTEHLGREKHGGLAPENGNVRSGIRPKTVRPRPPARSGSTCCGPGPNLRPADREETPAAPDRRG
jgi:hypothetical protein